MKDRLLICLVVLFILFLTGCATVKTKTMQDIYPKMYSNRPASILILPPMNKSTASEAKEYFSCSLAEPLAQMGYYPMPVEAIFSVLKQEGLYDTESISPAVLANLRKYFGADAVLVTTIDTWQKSYVGLAGSLTIGATYEILDTQTAEKLWDFHANIVVSLTSSSNNLLGQLVETAIKTAVEDYFSNAQKANNYTFYHYLPSGKHHSKVNADGINIVPASKSAIIRISK